MLLSPGHWGVFTQLGTGGHGLFLRDKRTSGRHK
ncbi:rCG44046 [Rattus norvegicus]|uniref:RCG44046 n=1 Tax=Rattus norvegicus TaxID=10116 RepID=A6J791_RAT|nr:rCG44046 [Rattus norvegicus]